MRALLALLLLSGVAGAAPQPRVGVAPARVDGADGDLRLAAPAVEDAVARGLAAGAVEVVGVAALQGIASRAARSGLACDAREASCAARLAAFSGLDFVVVTRAVAEAGGATVELALVDGRDGRTLRQRRAPVDDVGVGVAAVAAALLADTPVPGRLEVSGPADLAVVVDGADRGRAPLALEVEAGLHEVNGQRVRVPAGGVAVVEAHGEVVDRGPTAFAVATGVGAGVALLAGIGAFVVAPEAARRDAYTARAWNDAVGTGQALVAVAVVGGAVALVAGGLWLSSGGPTAEASP